MVRVRGEDAVPSPFRYMWVLPLWAVIGICAVRMGSLAIFLFAASAFVLTGCIAITIWKVKL